MHQSQSCSRAYHTKSKNTAVISLSWRKPYIHFSCLLICDVLFWECRHATYFLYWKLLLCNCPSKGICGISFAALCLLRKPEEAQGSALPLDRGRGSFPFLLQRLNVKAIAYMYAGSSLQTVAQADAQISTHYTHQWFKTVFRPKNLNCGKT